MNKNMVNLTVEEMRRKVMQLHPGDVVELQLESEELPITATLVKIYKNIVQFRKPNGTLLTTDYFTAMHANVIKPSGFERYSDDMAMADIEDAFQGISKD